MAYEPQMVQETIDGRTNGEEQDVYIYYINF